jgi:predicted PilT family ATPase
MPLEDVQESKGQSGLAKHALTWIKSALASQFNFDFFIQITWNSLNLYVPAKMKPRVIWSWGANIQSLEKSLSMNISVRLFSDLPLLEVQADQEINGKWTHMILTFPPEMADRDVALLLENTVLHTRIDNRSTVHVSGKWRVKALSRHGFVVVDMSNLA